MAWQPLLSEAADTRPALNARPPARVARVRPDSYRELPFEWPESPAAARNASKGLAPPPIVELLQKKPWLLAWLSSGRVPGSDGPVSLPLA